MVFIGKYAFEGNYNLNNLKLPSSANNYEWTDSNGDIHKGGEVVVNKSYSYVAKIPYTLQNTDVVVQNGVITSCSYFDDFTNIGSIITIPDKLDGQDIKGIGNSVFSFRGISEVILPNGLTSIENQAFYFNEIVKITLPNTLKKIGEYAFYNNCINTISFETTSTLETIGKDAFSFNRLIKIDFPKSVVKIEKYTFSNNFIQNISFETNSKLLSIGSYAFTGNNLLTSFTLPDPKINSYDYWVDWDNNKYSTNRIVTNFESFYKIPIEYTLTDADIVVVDGVIISCSLNNVNVNIINIPNTLDGQKITGITDGVFRTFGLIGVNLPANLKIIGYGAFAENDILNITIPESVEELKGEVFWGNNIDELIFEGNSKLTKIGWGTFYNNKITSLTLPDNLNFIENYAFGFNKISNDILIPDGVEYIGWGAFMSNEIPKVIFSENSILSFLGISAFEGNKISNEILIPKTLTEISDYAFRDNLISKVKIHDGIVEYGNGAFANNNPSLKIVLHKPPTIPFVTHFFGWKDNEGIYHFPGETILDFNDRYKAVIDQFFVVKFIVEDDNKKPIENASIKFYGSTLTTNVNGIDSIGPVLRGLQIYEVTASGCSGVSGSVDVQDNMTVFITLVRNYTVNINIIDKNNIPISGASVVINSSNLTSNSAGNANIKLPDGDYPLEINAVGFKESSFTFKVHDSDTTIIVKLNRIMVNTFPNGGTGAAFTDITVGSSYKTKNNPFTRNAYYFSPWNTLADNSGTNYSENATITLGYSDIDLFAIWIPIDYNIIYHLDGGINNSGNPVKYNTESEIKFLPATKTSLYFAYWKDADGNRVNGIDKGNTGDFELWAVFTTEPTYYIDYYNVKNASHNNQSLYTKFDLPMVFTDANKTGYQFIAWYEDLLFTKQISTIPIGSAKNYDIYAKWGGAIEYIITYNLSGGNNNSLNPNKYTIESDDIKFEPPTKTGAVFVNWYSNKELTQKITEIPQGSIGDTTIYAKWDLDSYNIHYELSGGNNNHANPTLYTIDSKNILFESPSKNGAKFIGWYNNINFTNKVTNIPQGSTGDTTIFAKWELEIFDIKYELNGGNNNPNNPSNYTFESNTITFEPPVKKGANFVGWFNDKNMTNKIDRIQQGSVGDTVIYAKWELDVYDIQYVLYGGNNNPANPTTYTIDSKKITFESPAKPGAKFFGWFNDNVFTKKVIDLPTGNEGDTILYAKWELDTFNIQYVLNGGINNSSNPAKYTIESNNIVFDIPSKIGAKFIAWYIESNLKNEITEIPKGSLGDTIVFAKWELDTFDIRYELNGGNNNPANPLIYTIESNTIVLESPDKTGFIFDGWFTNSSNSDSISSIPKGSAGDKTVYAKWIEIFKVQFVITTEGTNPASDIDIVIDNSQKIRSDVYGLADTLLSDGSSLTYSVELNDIVIDSGIVNVSGSDVIVKVEIVDCYIRWNDVLFCDNGKGLWTEFVWYKDDIQISNEQFFHNQGGIEIGKYKLKVKSVAGVDYIWEKQYNTGNSWVNENESDIFELNIFPNPVARNSILNVHLSEGINLQYSKVYIYNINGVLIQKINNLLYMNEIEIDYQFSSGLYYLVVFDDR
ncbi:MAG: leucine-rich repeat protein [Draconibacterium sp.]|nr:leucine-rich repeat protein [Draconibacterium sp.]